MSQEKPDYAAYLLRLWKSNELGQATWRASLESLAEGRRYNFGHLGDLVTFLLDRFGLPCTEREADEDNLPNPTLRRNS